MLPCVSAVVVRHRPLHHHHHGRRVVAERLMDGARRTLVARLRKPNHSQSCTKIPQVPARIGLTSFTRASMLKESDLNAHCLMEE